MRNVMVGALALAVLAASAACRSRAVDEHPHDAGAHQPLAAAQAEPETPVIELAGLRGIRLIVAPPPRPEGAWFAGEAIGDESAQAILSSPVSGRVAAPPSPVGRPVRRGALLLSIDSPEKAELLARGQVAQADAERAEAALAREQQLAAAGATSQRELEDAQREASIARTAVESTRLGLAARGLNQTAESGRHVLTAPGDGAVVSWDVRTGQGIEGGQQLGVFQLASARLVRLDLSLPGPTWHLGDETDARSSDGRRWKARVVGVPAILTADTRRLTFRLELTDGALPLPGQPVEVRVPYATSVILPQVAIQQLEGTWGVFVRSGDRAVFRPVRRGLELGSDVMILEGVQAGDEVVADGAYLLKSMWLKARSGGDEHEH